MEAHQPFIRYGHFMFATYTQASRQDLTRPHEAESAAPQFNCAISLFYVNLMLIIFCSEKCQAWNGEGGRTAEGSNFWIRQTRA